jgi:hypothetical protein
MALMVVKSLVFKKSMCGSTVDILQASNAAH